MSSLVEGDPSMHHCHKCTSCGSLCTFGTHAGDGADDGLVTDQFLNERFGIDIEVNYNYNLLI